MLSDDSAMPWGQYGPERGDPRKMHEVPAEYLHWIWCKGDHNDGSDIMIYIRTNLEALKQEHSDGIW